MFGVESLLNEHPLLHLSDRCVGVSPCLDEIVPQLVRDKALEGLKETPGEC